MLSLLSCFGIFFLQAQEDQLELLDLQLANYKYPYEVSTIEVHAQNQTLEMAFMDVKPKNYNGKNITIEALTAGGFRVIVPDQIGFGKSAKPDYFQYTFQQLALNTKAVLDSIGIEKTAVLGHSMGGMLATRFALMFPETTEKLILENPIGLEDWKLKVPYKPVEWWYKNELKKSYSSIKNYQLESYYDGNWDPSYDEWVNLLAGWTLNSDYETIAWNAALTYEMVFTQPVVYDFEKVSVPTLLIIGTRDRTALGKNLVSDEQSIG